MHQNAMGEKEGINTKARRKRMGKQTRAAAFQKLGSKWMTRLISK